MEELSILLNVDGVGGRCWGKDRTVSYSYVLLCTGFPI